MPLPITLPRTKYKVQYREKFDSNKNYFAFGCTNNTFAD